MTILKIVRNYLSVEEFYTLPLSNCTPRYTHQKNSWTGRSGGLFKCAGWLFSQYILVQHTREICFCWPGSSSDGFDNLWLVCELAISTSKYFEYRPCKHTYSSIIHCSPQLKTAPKSTNNDMDILWCNDTAECKTGK